MTNNKEVRQFSDLTDVECLSLSELTGCADHLSEQSQIHQVRELFQNNGFYNRQTNLPGRTWLKIIDYLRLIGIDVGDTTRTRSKIEEEWQLCPKCNGNGVLEIAQYEHATGVAKFTCDVCNGAKIIAKPVFESSKVEEEDKRPERFKRPKDKQVVGMAILVNDGKMERQKLTDMVALAVMIIDRLYENGDITIPSSKEK